ncbi:hypothetical protein DPEC_G00294510 [Dallia pectoralis]|uniref:Uncharacterized protein n=1 Tax=Dallia pectoralis TaxID=75939 RepID=A0ACC2FII2_DALPE|nr:hypothetical protein DPEC_G00294510 [Dallia pectoralis]
MISFWLSAVSDDDNGLPRKLLIAGSKTEDSDGEGKKRDIEQTWIKNGGATKRKAKWEKDSREDVMIRNIPTISTFLKSRLVEANKKPGGACCACDASNEEFSTTASSLANSDEPEPDLLEHQHQHDKKTENNSPAGVTDTCPSAPPTSTVPDSP